MAAVRRLAAVAVVAGLCLGTDPAAAGVMTSDDADIYRAAISAVEAGRGSDGVALAAGARNRVLQPVVEWLAIRNRASGITFRDAVDFSRAHPGWPEDKRMRRAAEDLLNDDTDAALVLQWFGNSQPLSVRGVTALARIQMQRQMQHAASDTVRAGWQSLEFSPTQLAEFLAEFERLLRPADHVSRLDRLIWDERTDEIARMLPLVPQTERRVAEARIAFQQRRPDADSLLQSLPAASMRDPGLLFELIRFHRRNENDAEAVRLMLANPTQAVRPDRWWRERSYLARELLKTGDPRTAYILASRHENDDGAAFAEAEFLAGWLATRFLRDNHSGYTHFVTLYRGTSTPISQSRGAYWAGRAAEAAGEKRIAAGWFEAASQHATTFYGQLAAERIGRSRSLAMATPPAPSSADRQRFEARELVKVLRALTQVDRESLLSVFVSALDRELTNPAERVLLAELMRETGRMDLAVRVAKSMLSDGLVLTELLFPEVSLTAYGETEQALVLALIRQESQFNATAISPAGARGLMQLMPATAKTIAKSLGVRYNSSRLTTDTEYNTLLGRAYLQQRLDEFGGSYILSLAAYNAGPHRVRRWLIDYGDPRAPSVDPVDWVEMIPFEETRNYVQRILEGVQVYRWRRARGQEVATLTDDLRR